MRSCGSWLAACVLASLTLPAPVRAQDAHAAELYKQALAREQVLRKELDAAPAAGPLAAALLARARTLVETYEDLYRLFPTSGYSDNALWQGALLSADTFWQRGDAVDRARALRLFQTLSKQFPTSSLLKQVPSHVARLEAASPASAGARQDARSSAAPSANAGQDSRSRPTAAAAERGQSRQDGRPRRSDAATSPAAQGPRNIAAAPVDGGTAEAGSPAQTARPASTAGPPSAASPSVLKSIRRDVLPDAIRVTLELEAETAYHHERIDGPSRVFIDMQNTRAAAAVRDANLSFADDVVRGIRVGRQLNARIRVVLDLSNAGKYSVYSLYDPFRIVIDLERSIDKPTTGQLARTDVPKATGTTTPMATPPVVAAVVRDPRPVAESAVMRSPVSPAARPPTAGSPVAVVTPDMPGANWTDVDAKPAVTAPAADAAPRATPAATSAPIGPSPAASASDAAARPKSTATSVTTVPLSPPPGEDVETRAASPATALPAPAAAPLPPPSANSTGSFSLSRQLGLGVARIVIDPGHGGRDPGARVKGLTEADLTLDVALRLEKLLLKQPGVEVVLTRRTNTYVPLEERTAIANRVEADLFLSIHANASASASARGVETYFLNFAPTPEAEAIAARENAGSAKTMRNLPDIVRAIALNNKIDESRDFAANVQTAMFSGLRKSNKDLRNLGVKQAPFMVLIGATMPSILTEISFITHKQEATLLKTEKYRQQIADALFQGVMRYQHSLKKVPVIALQE